jgi:hypothetical protein
MCGATDGIEPRHRGARAEQHDRGAGEIAVLLGHHHLGGGRAQKVSQAAAGEVVGGKDPMLERIERFEIGGLRLAQPDGGRGLVGGLGTHLQPIATLVLPDAQSPPFCCSRKRK